MIVIGLEGVATMDGRLIAEGALKAPASVPLKAGPTGPVLGVYAVERRARVAGGFAWLLDAELPDGASCAMLDVVGHLVETSEVVDEPGPDGVEVIIREGTIRSATVVERPAWTSEQLCWPEVVTDG